MNWTNRISIQRFFVIPTLVLFCAFSSPGLDAPPAKESRFLAELRTLSYPDALPPDKAPIFRWDFSTATTYRYSFDQKVVMSMKSSLLRDSNQINETNSSARGKLLIKSLANRTANLILQDVRSEMTFPAGNSNDELDTMKQSLPTTVLQGVKEDGKLAAEDSSANFMLNTIFPLPPTQLETGQSVTVPAQMPFNASGSLLLVKGQYTITLTNYVTIANHKCARFYTEINVSDLDVPAELEGKYICSAKGASVFFFDVESRRFISGIVALLLSFDVDTPSPEIDLQDGKDYQLPTRTQMSMESDNLFKVTLEP